MVGDNMKQDIEGALGVGMRAVLVCRSGVPREAGTGCDALDRPPREVPVIRSLRDLPALL